MLTRRGPRGRAGEEFELKFHECEVCVPDIARLRLITGTKQVDDTKAPVIGSRPAFQAIETDVPRPVLTCVGDVQVDGLSEGHHAVIIEGRHDIDPNVTNKNLVR